MPKSMVSCDEKLNLTRNHSTHVANEFMNAGTSSRLRALLGNEAKLPYIRLNIQAPCPARGAGSRALALSDGGSRSTRRVVGGSFTLDAGIALGLSREAFAD